MIRPVSHSQTEIYQALFELAQSISGHNDLDSLCRGLAQSLRRVVEFDFLGLVLYDPAENAMRLHGLTTTLPVAAERHMVLPLDNNPAGWVWRNQAPLVIPRVAEETRWPEFIALLTEEGIHSITVVPLTSGDRRLGVLGFG